MVQRRGKKLGVATGQTLRNWLCVRRKCCPRLNLKDQNVILKSLNFGSNSVLKDYATAVDDGGLETTREDVWTRQELVLYSMNKRKRWLLPDIIAENIADEAFHEDCNYRVVLVERHLYSRFSSSTVADCKAVHNSRASQKCRKARGNRFSYEDDLRISQAAIRNRRAELRERRLERARTGRRIDVEGRTPRWRRHQQGLMEPGEAEIRYEVISPRRKYQYPWNTEKEQNLEDLTSPGWFRWYRRREADLVAHPHVKRKKTDLWDDPKWDGEVSDNGYVNEEDEVLFSASDTDECNEYITHGEDLKTFLGSFITQGHRNKCRNGAGRRKSRLPKRNGESEFVDCSNTATSHPTMQYGKGSAIYAPKEVFTVDTVDSEDEAKRSTSDASDSGFDSDGSLPTNLLEDPVVSWIDLDRVPSYAVLPNSLKRDFANGYVEGMADPRRFSVAVKGCSTGYITAVFTVREDLSENPSDAVNLRMRLCNANIPPDELHSAGQGLSCPETDPPSLVLLLQEVQKAVSSLERKAKENCVFPAIVKPGMTWNISQSLMGWTTDFGTTEDVHLQLEAEAVSQELLVGAFSTRAETDMLPREDFCGICYESRSAPSCLGGDGGLALLPCQHWFCEECWVQHIVSRVQMTETVIHCPAYKCQTVVDRTTLLSVLPDSLVSLHLARLQDNRISLHKQWKWCPNSRCGRLVKVGAPKLGSASGVGVPVLCECGLRWCSLCQKEAHWPASCRQAAKHWEALDVKAEEDSELVRSVDVKRCTKCQYPIEKFHGCSHMMCRCGFSFCWECLCAWEEHRWDRAGSPCPKSAENLETIWLFHRRRSAAIFSEYAIENRLKVKRKVIVRKHRVARALATKMFLNSDCKPSPGLQDDLRVITSGHFRGDGQESLMTWCNSEEEQHRLKELLAEAYNIVIFSVEIRGLLEYLCVLLWKGPVKLRFGQSGWRQMVTRLMFIVAQIEELLDGQQDLHLPPEQIWRRLGLLVRNGLSCVKDIARAMPLVHKRLEGKGQRSKVTQE